MATVSFQYEVLPGVPFETADGRSLTTVDGRAVTTASAGRLITMHVGETIETAGALALDTRKVLPEGFTTTESFDWRLGKLFMEAWRSAEMMTHSGEFFLSVNEHILTGESLGNATTKPFFDGFKTTDSQTKAIGKNVGETLHLAERFGRTVIYLRNIAEGLTTHEALGKANTKSLAETIAVGEEYRRRANAIMSDMSISNVALDETEFAALVTASSPPGYSNFRSFIPGDYTYQLALLRAVFDSSTTDRAVLDSLSLIVDVPDLFDSGEATVVNAATGIAVTYNRKFHDSPEVTLQLKGGTDILAVPKFLVQPSQTGFTVILVDSATGQNVTGVFSWSAHGY